jgi:hypothetical protein
VNPQKPSEPRWARWVTYGSVAAALIAIVITVVASGPRAILDGLISIGPWFGLIVAIEILGTACDAAALHGYVSDGKRRIGYFETVRAQVAGRAVSLVTPLGSLGEVTKTTMLMKHVTSQRAIAAVARWNLAYLGISLLAIVIGAPISAAMLDLPPWLDGMLYIGAAVAAVVLVAGATLVRRGMLSSVVGALAAVRIVSAKRRQAWRKKLRQVDKLVAGRSQHRAGIAPIGWLVLSRALNWLNAWVVLAAAGTVVGAGTMAALATAGIAISFASTMVPLGLGIAEGGNAALFVALGLDASLGVTLAISRRVIQVLYAIIGLSFVATTGGWRKLRAMASRPRAITTRGTPSAAFPRAS